MSTPSHLYFNEHEEILDWLGAVDLQRKELFALRNERRATRVRLSYNNDNYNAQNADAYTLDQRK